MNVLVTGGAGFIGSHTCKLLAKAGHRVRVLDILDPQIHGPSASFGALPSGAIECLRGDVCSLSDCMSALEGIDAIMHFAARTGVGQSMYDIADYVETNVRGTATLLEAIVKSKTEVKRFVLSSSRAVYGEGLFACERHGMRHPDARRRSDMLSGRFDVMCPDCGAPMDPRATPEDSAGRPLSAYAMTKKHQEELCSFAMRTFDLPLVVLRYFNVFGSGQSLRNPYTGVVSVFYSLLRSGREVSLYERGKPIRDFVHVEDVARANLLALERDAAVGQTFNVGSGSPHCIADVATALAEVMRVRPQFVDRGEFRVGDIFACFADLERSASVLGYLPVRSLAGGMKEFVAWASEREAVDLYDKTVSELKQHGLFGTAQQDANAEPR